MRIDFFCADGSPLGVIPEDIYGRGVGGAELALLSLTEALAGLGHEIWIYNNPRSSVKGSVQFADQRDFFDDHQSAVFVLFRSPHPALQAAHTQLKIFWSCDQFTIGSYKYDVFPYVDCIVAISQYHKEYHIREWGADPSLIGFIDLGVRLQDYEEQGVRRVPGQLIYCSVPDRGLILLHELWLEIKQRVPHATLVITGDYRLWGSKRAGTHRFRLMFGREGSEGVSFLGKVPRERLVREQLRSEFHAYPCWYPELFCIAAAECQVAGAIPITSTAGALKWTNRWGVRVPGNPRTAPWKADFVEQIVKGLTTNQEESRAQMMKEAREQFDWTKIAGDWIRLIEQGKWPGEEG